MTGTLARALGDPSLTVAYWVREGRAYADADGSPVTVLGRDGADHDGADPEGGRAVTLVAQGSDPIAALIHDPVLRRQPALLASVTRASLLVLENARLRAEVSIQLAEVRRSRAGSSRLEITDRQRMERDLRDGAPGSAGGLALRPPWLARPGGQRKPPPAESWWPSPWKN